MNREIDFVLPWVDPSDKDWQDSKNTHSKTSLDHQYRDMNTLKYVLRSIEENCPWYNKIHIITCGHTPEWLNTEHARINIIKHEDLYFQSSDLPTFSSSSIEMNLPNMKGVSEKFIYLNDDCIILNQLDQSRFFKKGKPVDFFSHGWIKRGRFFGTIRKIDTWVSSLNNIINLINKDICIKEKKGCSKSYLYHRSYTIKTKISNLLFERIHKKLIWIEHWHHPQPYLMSSLKETYKRYKNHMDNCSKNKFRSNDDLTQYIYRYKALMDGEYYPTMHKDGLCINIKSTKHTKKTINRLNKTKQINFICFNDSNITNSDFILIKNEVNYFLEGKFPKKASFEKRVMY